MATPMTTLRTISSWFCDMFRCNNMASEERNPPGSPIALSSATTKQMTKTILSQGCHACMPSAEQESENGKRLQGERSRCHKGQLHRHHLEGLICSSQKHHLFGLNTPFFDRSLPLPCQDTRLCFTSTDLKHPVSKHSLSIITGSDRI